MASVSHTNNTFWLPKNLTRFNSYMANVVAFTSVGEGPKVWIKFYVNDGKSGVGCYPPDDGLLKLSKHVQ